MEVCSSSSCVTRLGSRQEPKEAPSRGLEDGGIHPSIWPRTKRHREGSRRNAPGGDDAPAAARSQTMHQMMAAMASRGGRDAGHGGGLPTASMQAPEEMNKREQTKPS
jgi:hypothetical protein